VSADTPPDDATQRKVGKKGSVFEDNPEANRHASARVRVLRKRKQRKGASAAAAAVESMGDASKKLDPGGQAAPDHGAPVGARNILDFHKWQKQDEVTDDSGDGEPGDD
jgi:hypothetical protein